MPLVHFLKKEGLIFKYARSGQNRVEYFRYDDYTRLKESSSEKITSNEKIRDLVKELDSSNHLVFYKRPSDLKNLKYPHIL